MAVTANKPHPRGVRTALALPFLVLAYAPAALALDWRFEPNVSASATYTDNANSSATNPQDALILTVTPGFSLRSEGSRRVQASLQYGLTAVSRFGEDNSNDLYHRLSAVGNAELVEDFLFIDGSANISQELISLLGPTADAETNDSNRSTVGTYSISPYIQQRFGTFANALVRYTASGAIFENNTAADSSVNSLAAGLSSGTRFNDLSWALDYSIRKAENRNATTAAANSDTTFERASATVGYALTRQFRVFGTVGEDKNEYLSTSGTDGSFYSAGFGWSPTRRTSVEASAGKRYFGDTFSFSGSHRTRMTRWTVRYYEDVSDISQQLLEQSNRTFWVCNVGGGRLAAYPTELNPQPPLPTCLPDPVTPFEMPGLGFSVEELIAKRDISLSIANGVYIIKSLTAGVSWDIGRLAFGLSAQDTRRLYQVLSDAEDHVQGITGSVSYRMAPQTTASGGLSLTRTSTDSQLTQGGVAREEDQLTLSLGLNHRFAEKLNGALTLRHTQRDSNAANSDYDVNSITATVNMGF